jgi:GTP-binding protein Era
LKKQGGAHRSGFAAIAGRPNVGKSTLLNGLVGQKVAIVSPKPQTTRSRILGVVTRPGAQIAFVDTPGLHEARGGLNARMVDRALRTIADADAVLFLIEAGPPRIDPAMRKALEHIAAAKKPTVLVINKIDLLPRDQLLPLIERWRGEHPFAEIYPLSALTGENVDGLLDTIVPYLPEGDPLFPEDVFTDVAERDLCAELIREQVLRQTEKEVPYSAAVLVEEFDESERKVGPRGLVRILATLLVERDSQKAIVIGKGGARLKEIGARARAQMEKLLGNKVCLQLHVRVEKDWTGPRRVCERRAIRTLDPARKRRFLCRR